MVAQYDPTALPVNLRGDHRRVIADVWADEYRRGATVDDLAALWHVDRRTVIRLLAEVAIDARRRLPRPSPEWRVENLPPEVLPADLDAEPTPEEWIYICEFLSVRRAGGATIRALAAETGLRYTTVHRRLAALCVQPDETPPLT
jgi:hypothetical protein